MAGRLHLKYGLVSEGDRLESSPDTILVTEPTVGSVLRSKGSLYTVVTARRGSGGRAHEATALVAETIRREYYYDESAGIPHCLDKAVRSANRRLRHQREGQGLGRGSLGAVVAIVRGHELYVATIGEGEAYLVRQARLLTLPEEERGEGLPSPDDPHVDVWRGDLAAGDSLLLVSRNLVRVVGTEELKNAVVTLHPQSAVEHLHHLFVAAGGDGSDAVLAVEATDARAGDGRRAAARPQILEEDEPEPSRLPPPVAAALDALATGAQEVQGAVASAFWAVWDRFADLFPRRRSRYRRVASAGNRRDAQRRAAFAVLGMVGVVAVVGVSAWLIADVIAGSGGGGRSSTPTSVEVAIADARDRLDEVNDNDLIVDDEARAMRLLREAWNTLGRAAQPGENRQVDAVRNDVRRELDRIYQAFPAETKPVVAWSSVESDPLPIQLEIGPDGAAYTIDQRSGAILRIDLTDGTSTPIVVPGEGDAEGMAEPWLLADAERDLLILDRGGLLWRWRPGDGGNLREIPVAAADWSDVIDIAAYVRTAGSQLYNLYVVDPSDQQIVVYTPAGDGNSFPNTGVGRLANATDMSAVRKLAIDGDIYLLSVDKLSRFRSGRPTDFELDTLPDDGDVRPTTRWNEVALTGVSGTGSIFVSDYRHRRIVEYNKVDGRYVRQFVSPDAEREFVDIRGMDIIDPADGPPTLVWLNRSHLWLTPLEAPSSSPSPSASP